MAWWVTLLVYVVSTVLYEVLRPKMRFDSPDPSSLGDFQFPTIGEGRVIPIVWGTCKLSGPMVTWYGDLEVEPIRTWVRTVLWMGQRITTGYRYYLGMQLVFCSGEIDELVEIRFDDRESGFDTYTPSGDYTLVQIDDPELFGGEESDGGVVGEIYVYHGTDTQTPDSYLEETIGEDLPAWRGICHAVFSHVYLGTSPYIKEVSAVVRRCPNGLSLTGGDHNIAGDANPACMLLDLLTSSNAQNGLGLPVGLIDLETFRSVGQTLATEGMGLSMVADQATSAKDLVLEILRHIDAILYVEPSTGLLTLRLVRADYEIDELPTLDADSCTVKSFARPSWSEVKNSVRVSYVDRADGFTSRMVQAQELASIEVQGGEVSAQELRFRGFSNATAAQQAAARALAALAYPLATVTIEADRSAWAFRPGSVFKLVWPPLGITGMVCRVVRVGTGRLDSGRIEIEAMEDVFAVDWTAYTPPPSTGWVDPAGDVPALTDQAALAAPYEAVKDSGSKTSAVVLAARGDGAITTGYRVYLQDGLEWGAPVTVRSLTPSGLLADDLDPTSDEVVVSAGPDTGAIDSVSDADFGVGVNVLWIEGDTEGQDEFIAFRDMTRSPDGTLTLTHLARGCLDTTPSAFSAGVRAWFISHGSGIATVRDGANTLRYQPFNNRSERPLSDCDDTELVATIPDGADEPLILDALATGTARGYAQGVAEESGGSPVPSGSQWYAAATFTGSASMAAYGTRIKRPCRADQVLLPTGVRINGAAYPLILSSPTAIHLEWQHRNRLDSWSYSDSGVTDTPEDGTQYHVQIWDGTELIHSAAGVTGTSYSWLETPPATDQLRVVVFAQRSADGAQSWATYSWTLDTSP